MFTYVLGFLTLALVLYVHVHLQHTQINCIIVKATESAAELVQSLTLILGSSPLFTGTGWLHRGHTGTRAS